MEHPAGESGQFRTGAPGILGNELTDRLRKSLPSANKVVDDFNKGNLSLAALTDVLAFHLPLDMEFKLKLLGEVDVLNRAKLLLAALPAGSADTKKNATYPPKFSAN